MLIQEVEGGLEVIAVQVCIEAIDQQAYAAILGEILR
jgi:hypothetical protein